MHGFVDASERGYSAAVYLWVTRADDTRVFLLTAKSKIAPIKPASLPRLELCVVLTNLVAHTRTVLSLVIASIRLWSDSKITLQWIQGHASKWKTLALPIACRWSRNWCRTLNGVTFLERTTQTISGTASEIIHSDSSTPFGFARTHQLSSATTPRFHWTRCQNNASHNSIKWKVTESEFLLRFSSLHQVLTITAWCLHWLSSKKTPLEPGVLLHTLTSHELDMALFRWFRVSQELHYSTELNQKPSQVSPWSQLYVLNLFLDKEFFKSEGD